MRRFLVEARTEYGDFTSIVESPKNTDLSMDLLADGEEPDDFQKQILEELDIEYDPESLLDQVSITELCDIPIATISV